MSEWGNFQLRVYDEYDTLQHSTDELIEAQGNAIWHEAGRGASVRVRYTGISLFTTYANGRRVYVTAVNTMAATTHVICDFIVESCDIEETTLEGGGVAPVLVVKGRDRIKRLVESPAGRRCISKRRVGTLPTAVTETTLQMNATDAAAYAGTSFIGWTIELEDGNWSEVVDHTAGGLITIDPPWQVSMDDGPAPPVQKWSVYGAAFTETTGADTDIKQAFAGLPAKAGWEIDAQGYQSTVTGSFVAAAETSILKTLQTIAVQTGEYFIRTPGTKKIRWMRAVPPITHPSYGYPLQLVVPLAPLYNNIQNATILPGAKYRRESYEVVTRVKPIGGGSGDLALSLKNLPSGFTPAAGYSIDGEYLVYDAAETTGTEVGKELRFDAIGPASDSEVSKQTAAQALYRAALNWLKERQTTRIVIDLEVLSPIPIYPVAYVRVNLAEYEINNVAFYILESTATLKDGRVIYKLQLSNKQGAVMDDDRVVAEAIRATDTQIFYTTAPARNSRRIDKAVYGGGGAGTDHEPVTAGNAAISVATGQVVSLALESPSGLEIGASGLRLSDGVAGNGLIISSKALHIGLPANSGLVLAADTLALGTPGTLSASTTNAVSGAGHTHAVTAVTNAKTSPTELLKSDASGDLWLRFLTADKLVAPEVETASGNITLDPASGKTINDGNLEFTGARSVTTSSGSLTLAPTAGLIADPTDDNFQLNANTAIKTANWSSGFLGTGWGITYAGAGDFRTLTADELHVAAFIADTARVKVGAEYITPSMAIISRNFTIPAVSSTGTLYVEDAPGLDDTAVFADNDWLLLRIIDRPAGGLNVLNVWGQVSGYSNLADGEQSWTFTTRSASAAAVGEVARLGGIALDFGKSGDGWIWLTTLDATGSPYLGITTWQGANPYTEGNRSHKLRLGQLSGVSGAHEWGLQAGQNTANFIRFSDIRSEIHGSRLSLYAGDGAQLRVRAVRVQHYRAAGTLSNLLPNADHSVLGVLSTGATYYTEVDENPASPTTSDYIYNNTNRSGYVFLGLQNPTWTGSTYQVDLHANIEAAGFTNDTVRVYGQVFDADELTPLTSEKLIYSATTNTTATVTVTCDQHDTTATQTQWNAARLRLRWEYEINAAEEAIRLDPNTPSIAVGNPLPSDYQAGGNGLWAGLSGGANRVRIGDATGPNLRWTGAQLRLADSGGTDTIVFDNAGASYFAGPMTLGTSGGIYQGTGTFASPTSGLKLFNSSGQGHLALFNAGTQRVTMRYDRGIEIANPGAQTNASAVNFTDVTGGTVFGGLYGSVGSAKGVALEATNGTNTSRLSLSSTGTSADVNLFAGNTYLEMRSNWEYAQLHDADFYISERGLAVGYPTYIPLNRGQIASDFAGEHDYNALVLQDTTDVAHGMTTIVGTGTYGALGKRADTTGGLKIIGATEASVGVELQGYGTTEATATSTATIGNVTVNAFLKSGTGVTSHSATANIFAVRNNDATKFIIKGNGDFHYDGTGSAYDDFDDVGLLRALSREMWSGTIDGVWDRFVAYNRRHLIDAGIMSEAGFINGAALNRLLTGAIWQLNERLQQLEESRG